MQLIKLNILGVLLSINTVVHAQITEFNQPWLDTNKAIIIDFYSGNNIVWEDLKKDKQLVAIIHKSSQGFRVDGKYKERRDIALQQGYKWGSYHLGTPGDPVAQADYYISLVGDHPEELLALDLESDDSTKHMNLRNASIFIHRIFEKTGRYPVVYCNKNMLTLIHQSAFTYPVFSKCKLWYARFRADIPDFQSPIWTSYTLWQFSSEINCKKTGECLYNVPGTLHDMDVNVFNGTRQQLIDNWPFN